MRTGTVQQTAVNDKSGLVSCQILSLGGDSWFAKSFKLRRLMEKAGRRLPYGRDLTRLTRAGTRVWSVWMAEPHKFRGTGTSKLG